MSSAATASYGLTAVPASASALEPTNSKPSPVSASSLNPPSSAVAQRIQSHIKSRLPEQTYNHSMRVYSYGLAIARQCFPEWGVTEGSRLEETWFLTAMLHDIGTTPDVIGSTRLSYEFWAGVHALEVLQQGDGVSERDQAESVCEAVIRHQDVQDKGFVTLVTQMIQLGTLLDNVGAPQPAKWVHSQTIESVNQRWPREGWSGCFAGTVTDEKRLKPYAMVTRIEAFEDAIMGNGVTAMGKGN